MVKKVGQGQDKERKKGETVADYVSRAASWALMAWIRDHRISFLGEIGFEGTDW